MTRSITSTGRIVGGRPRRAARVAAHVALGLLLAQFRTATLAHADDLHAPPPAADAGESNGHPDAQKLFEATSHRRFDDVEYWVGVFDDPERDEWQDPALIVGALDLEAGETVADIGAGTGYMLDRLAHAVGNEGSVYAVEVEPTLVAHLRDRSEKQMLGNVVPVLASLGTPRLPKHSVDAVLLLDTYHHVNNRRDYLQLVAAAMRPGARLVVVDWFKREQTKGPPPPHKIPQQQVERELTEAGFTRVAAPRALTYQYVLTYERRTPDAPKR